MFFLFRSCQNNPFEKIQGIVKTLGNKFVSKYLETNQSNEDEAKNKLELAITLFYKFIENILQNEKTIRKDISVSQLLSNKILIFRF